MSLNDDKRKTRRSQKEQNRKKHRDYLKERQNGNKAARFLPQEVTRMIPLYAIEMQRGTK